MSTFAQDIERAAGGEEIEAVVIGSDRSIRKVRGEDRHEYVETGRICSYRQSDRDLKPSQCGTPIAWTDARPLLDYPYDSGFGGEDCHRIYAWTKSFVLAVHEYDGSTTVITLPRHPVPEEVDWA